LLCNRAKYITESRSDSRSTAVECASTGKSTATKDDAMHHAKLEINCKNPKIVVEALKPDLEDDIKKFSGKIKAEKNSLTVSLESDTISGLAAGINSYLRLIKAASEVSEIEQ